MNPITAMALDGMMAQDEKNKLIRLRDLLIAVGINAELRENNSALMVHRPDPGLPLWVFVGYGGTCYSWDNANKRYPANDPKGAATILADYIRSC